MHPKAVRLSLLDCALIRFMNSSRAEGPDLSEVYRWYASDLAGDGFDVVERIKKGFITRNVQLEGWHSDRLSYKLMCRAAIYVSCL